MIPLSWKIKLDRFVRKFRYTIYDGDPYSPTFHEPYMTRYRFGRLMVHVFYRADNDDPHDHPWPFWTFPLHSYVEEVFTKHEGTGEPYLLARRQVVQAFRLHYREPGHIHRIRGRYAGKAWNTHHRQVLNGVSPYWVSSTPELEPYHIETARFVTIVWRGREVREWGFWKYRGLHWCWQKGKEYYNGGKHDLCG